MFGDLILDHYVLGQVSRISPEAPIPVLHVATEHDRLGGAANVAANILSLGGRCTLVGVLGDDDPGARFRALAGATAGLELRAHITKRRPTVLKTRMVSQNQQMLRVDREDPGPLNREEFDRLHAATRKAVRGAGALVISDYAKGVVSKDAAAAVIRDARKYSVPVLVDPKGRDYARYKGATAVTPNRAEAEAATGIDCSDLAGVEKAGRKLCRALELEFAVITLSADGVAVIPKKGRLSHFSAPARSVFDVTGAGDTFIAGLALCIAHGADFNTAARLANHAAALTVARFGAVTIARDELRRSLIGAHEGFDHAGKVLSRRELVNALKVHRERGEKIVFTNGCFDLLHQGHVTYLNFCRGQGDLVVVGLNSDKSVRRLKGPGRPVNGAESRARVLAALADVEYVSVFDEDTPEKLIRAAKPNVLVKGEDWQGKKVAGAEFMKRSGGRVAFAPMVEGQSTTSMIGRARGKKKKGGPRGA